MTKQEIKKAIRLAEKEIKQRKKYIISLEKQLDKLENKKPLKPDWLCNLKYCSCRDWERKNYQPRLEARKKRQKK